MAIYHGLCQFDLCLKVPLQRWGVCYKLRASIHFSHCIDMPYLRVDLYVFSRDFARFQFDILTRVAVE